MQIVVYWAILFDRFESTFDTYDNVSVHAMNTVIAFFEILLTRTSPLAWWHDAPIVIVLACYLGLAYVTHATQGFYVYDFLDDKNGTKRGTVAGYCIGILVAAIVIHLVVHFIIVIRVWATEKKAGMLGKPSPRDPTRLRGGDVENLELVDTQFGKRNGSV